METFFALLAICARNSPSPVNSPHKGQWRGALVLSLICAWINGCINNLGARDLRRHLAHYDATVVYNALIGSLTDGGPTGLSPVRHRAITWTNVDLSWIEPSEINVIEIWIRVTNTFFKENVIENVVYKMSYGHFRPHCVNMILELVSVEIPVTSVSKHLYQLPSSL